MDAEFAQSQSDRANVTQMAFPQMHEAIDDAASGLLVTQLGQPKLKMLALNNPHCSL